MLSLFHQDFTWKKFSFMFLLKLLLSIVCFCTWSFHYPGVDFQRMFPAVYDPFTSEDASMVWWPQTFSLRTLILFWSIFKSVFIYVDKIQVFPSRLCLIRMLGTDSENRTVSLGWSYLFQTYDNSIIDIFIMVSESFNSAPWDKTSQYSEHHFCLGSENVAEWALGGIRGQPTIFFFFCNGCKYLSVPPPWRFAD